MNKLRILAAISCFISLSNLLISQSPKTFYIGHSLSDQIPDMVKSLTDDHPTLNFDWVYQSIPGAPLRWQWDRKDANDYGSNPPFYAGFYDAEYGLPTGEFDILVLTESVPRHMTEWGIEETYQYADSFYVYASTFNPNTKVYLYEVWHCLQSGTPTGCDFDIDSNPWRQRLTDDLPMWEGVVDTLNARFDPVDPVCLIPAGQGLARLYDSIQVGAVPGINSIEDLFSDEIHLTDIGKYFVACVHFATIHETSPVGLTNQLQVWWGGNFDAPSGELALKFQEIAWETVMEYENSCVQPILPVELIAFSGKALENKAVELQWQTGSEINNDYFEVQRSNDLQNWSTIFTEKSKVINSTSRTNYSALDMNPSNEINYYRLKQVDIDEKFNYSKIISVHLDSKINVSIFPNPVKDFLYVKNHDLTQEIKIFSSTGQQVLSSFTSPINVSHLTDGMYHLIVGGSKNVFIKN